ncbi:ATP phosphoribosyltransferase regulatory subunit [Hydrogenothermus marinus]|uniref:ATP phosphoribosyltransferase regulatory subunit n=1 Tax=Hydrogenothermus marinus TaxID=133270 RepID=A0A3M0BIH9_9AQUI|nr:ATP phosphoribosyltransferase regulatory subunit [Hydrogenothermus marinus]RMA97001.1 ATP phosphoribosyltransferase regulatory subunit [Hydrogenothermus marinus]
MNIGLPKGVKSFSPQETVQIEYIQKNISDTIEKWGYEKLYLPIFEYYEVHKKGIGDNLKNLTFRFVDRNEGDILTLRADFTAQIARYVASLKEKEFPLRFYYNDDVYRYTYPKADKLWQIRQLGIELIGSDRYEADAEVIAIAVNSLKNLNIENFQIDINNVAIFYSLKDLLNLTDKEFKTFMEFIKKREIFNIKRFTSDRDIDEVLKEFVLNLPKYQGDINLIIDLKEKLSKFKSINKALQKLIDIYQILKEYNLTENIRFDLGEPKEFDYYTGLVFEIFIKDFKKPIGIGGRYDNLLSKFNGNIPATGFAFDIINLWQYMKEKDLVSKSVFKDYFIIDLTDNKKLAYKIGITLRKKGYKVGRDIVDRPLEESLNFAFKSGYKNVIVIGIEKNTERIHIYKNKKEFEIKNIEEILK